MIILLIGLNHCHQLAGYAKASNKFKPYLNDLCLKEHPDLLAEELNEDAIKKWTTEDSVARKIARRLNVRHLFCDPDVEERRALGIKSFNEIARDLGYEPGLTREQIATVEMIEKEHWGKREKFWLAKLTEKQFDKSIFLLGANHVDRFNTLLIANSYQSSIVERDWQP